jgi:HAMP domain-containing protein
MAVSAAASGLSCSTSPVLRQRASGPQARRLAFLLFTGAAVAGALAAVGGLIVGLNLAGRIRGIVEKAEAFSPHLEGEHPGQPRPPTTVRDELGALDAAVGRLTLSMDRFVRDSDILARLPEGMLLLDPAGTLVSFNATAEALLDLSLEPYRGEPILSEVGAFPLASGNGRLAAAARGGSDRGRAGARQRGARGDGEGTRAAPRDHGPEPRLGACRDRAGAGDS